MSVSSEAGKVQDLGLYRASKGQEGSNYARTYTTVTEVRCKLCGFIGLPEDEDEEYQDE